MPRTPARGTSSRAAKNLVYKKMGRKGGMDNIGMIRKKQKMMDEKEMKKMMKKSKKK